MAPSPAIWRLAARRRRPTLDIQAASTHTKPDSSLQVGTIEAFIPAGALLNLYGLLPADASDDVRHDAYGQRWHRTARRRTPVERG